MSGEQTGIPILVRSLVFAIKWLAVVTVTLLVVIAFLIVYIAKAV